MSKKLAFILAGLMLGFMVIIAFFSMLGDSAIMDEVAHLPAGYSYIEKADMRLNPEHPPLVKDLAGLSIWLGSKITGQEVVFPETIKPWQTDINGQWDFGFNFMYQSGNDADWLLLWGRLPMLLILLLLGIYVFKWAGELFGRKAALFALFFYSFSPTFIAHGRFVTTDVAAAAAIFIAVYYFMKWLKAPNAKNLIVAGIIFGLAQLAKFSVFLLIPLFGAMIFLWIILKTIEGSQNGVNWLGLFFKNLGKYLGGVIAIGAIGYIFVVWPVYSYHVANYPMEMQQRDIKLILSSFGMRWVADLIYWMAGIPVLRGLAQYGFGLAMVIQRAAGGNTTYFLGEISAAGSRLYFPFVYLTKEALTLHILSLIALILGIASLIRQKFFSSANFLKILRDNINQIAMIGFIALYWGSSIRSPLNIGVRHILPTFPFIFLLVSNQIGKWIKFEAPYGRDILKNIKGTLSQIKWLSLKCFILGILLIWQITSVVSVYPSFLSYYNESVGGPANGYKYVTDSNTDWGQDLKRLAAWVNENNIKVIYIDYFGGSIPSYYMGDKVRFWWGYYTPQDMTESEWLAVSATFRQGGLGDPAPGYKDRTGYYKWLEKYQPVKFIGNSIFIYRIPKSSIN